MSILAQGPQTYHRLEEEEGFNNAFRTSDLLLLAGRQDPTAVKPWYRRPAFLWFLGIAMASMVTGAIVWTAVRTSQSEAALYSPECMLPLGGGYVGPGGSMNSMRTDSTWCTQQIQLYFNKRVGVYYKEVEAIARSAIAYFEKLSLTTPPSPEQVVVFDIDETVLSNAVEWMGSSRALAQQQSQQALPWDAQPQHSSHWSFILTPASHYTAPRDRLLLQGQQGSQAPRTTVAASTGSRSKAGVASSGQSDQQQQEGGSSSSGSAAAAATTTADSQAEVDAGRDVGERIVSRLAGPSLKGANAVDRPPLEAVRELYRWLYAHNYSVAFITGRKEAARADTSANLALAGYGTLCPTPDGANASTPNSGRTREPCYVALHLRQESDNRLASVFKPERRKQIQDLGFILVGNIGDQFSDLEGLWHADASWKLPNPAYYIM
uniref:Acid phosphatase n=1 Tax=Chlamydomonas leiostraca TaxID=1034604 RepID=A0A7S0RZW2_9CHLO